MELLLTVLLVLMIPGLLTYLVPQRHETAQDSRAQLSPVSPSQQPSLKRQRGHCHVPWRHSISALQRRQRSTVATTFAVTPSR